MLMTVQGANGGVGDRAVRAGHAAAARAGASARSAVRRPQAGLASRRGLARAHVCDGRQADPSLQVKQIRRYPNPNPTPNPNPNL